MVADNYFDLGESYGTNNSEKSGGGYQLRILGWFVVCIGVNGLCVLLWPILSQGSQHLLQTM